jgi:hypothetical protein
MEAFGVTLSSQSALYNALCQFLWFSETVIFIILIKFLFVEGSSWKNTSV